MKNKVLLICLFLVILVSCCSPTKSTNPNYIQTIPSEPSLPLVQAKTDTAQSSTVIPTATNMGVQQYEDVRAKDLSHNGVLGEPLIASLWFDQDTIWSPQDISVAERVLNLGMNPGMGVKELHDEGITGKGVTVAIVEQNLALNNTEFQNKVYKYLDLGTGSSDDIGSMHGPAVTSLLIGKNIGTAPDARLVYVAVPSWKYDAKYYADALDWLIGENAKLPANDKIRVVSISAAPSGIWSEFTTNTEMYDEAYQRATDAGIIVLDCTFENGITLACANDLSDPDNIGKCIPNWYPAPRTMHNRINIPTTRTTIEEKGKNIAYQFTGYGGMSWTTPYLAGILAMGWQINPQLSDTQILEILFDSAYTTKSGEKIVDPKAFIDKVQHTIIE